MDKEIYLSDEQYLQLLYIGRTHLDGVKHVYAEDSTCTGNKYTTTNVGLCNEELCTKEIALWPHKWPGRKTIKYRASGQKCPLDTRVSGDTSSGCFYHCVIFQKKCTDIEHIKQLYDTCIATIEAKGGATMGIDTGLQVYLYHNQVMMVTCNDAYTFLVKKALGETLRTGDYLVVDTINGLTVMRCSGPAYDPTPQKALRDKYRWVVGVVDMDYVRELQTIYDRTSCR